MLGMGDKDMLKSVCQRIKFPLNGSYVDMPAREMKLFQSGIASNISAKWPHNHHSGASAINVAGEFKIFAHLLCPCPWHHLLRLMSAPSEGRIVALTTIDICEIKYSGTAYRKMGVEMLLFHRLNAIISHQLSRVPGNFMPSSVS